jgi:hypothetical protein
MRSIEPGISKRSIEIPGSVANLDVAAAAETATAFEARPELKMTAALDRMA